jgi:DNA-directed RNA polymerase subunit M/transcription elongation factor TFIIS
MKKTKEGFLCPKCGDVIHTNFGIQSENVRKIDRTCTIDLVSVVDDSQDNYVKISQLCPKCGNKEAFHWFSEISGEHAGVRRERTIEHFKCTKCAHSWSKSS